MFRRRLPIALGFPWLRSHGSQRKGGLARRRIALEALEERRLLTAVRQLAGFSDNALARGDDISSDIVDLGFEINFFGESQDEIFVNTNGAVTFDGPLQPWSPQPLDTLKRNIIAPFWADVDTRPDTTGMVTFGSDTVDGHSAFGVNWIDVGSFDQNETPTNSFQMVIVERGDVGAGAFDLEFNYDEILWDTADISTEPPIPERPAARAGFSSARGFPGTFYELIGSAIDDAFLDSNQTVGLATHSLQSTEPGRYVFEFRGGSPLDEFGLAGQAVEVAPGFVFLGSGMAPDELLLEKPTNVDAADTTNTDRIQVGGDLNLDLTGAGLTVGVWEAGGNNSYVRTTHQELNGRVTVVDDGAPTFSNHATHVAGTIAAAGVNAAAQGMATAVNLLSYSSAGAAAEMAAAAAGIVASNHSYGIDEGWSARANIMSLAGMNFDTWLDDRAVFTEDPGHGKYTANSVAMDNVIANNPNLLSVFSAGNERNDTFGNRLGTNQYVSFFSVAPAAGTDLAPMDPGWWLVPNAGATAAPAGDGNGGTGFDTITTTQTAKNILTVGAIQDITVDPITGVTLANHSAFSSFGPTDDGRIKPDIVGNGVGLFSSVATNDTAYDTFDGTSMAAPNITGTATLLIQHHMNLFGSQPTAARTKGVLLHNAFDAGNVGPDYSFGWGLADAAASAEFLNSVQTPVKGRLDALLDRTYTGQTQDFNFNVSSGQPLKATIVWTDPAGNPQAAGLDLGTPALVNDLDLTIIGPGGAVFNPWTLDPANPANPAVRTTRNAVDNVEQVLIDAPAGGTYTVRVSHTGGIQEESQNFTLLVSGALFAPDQFEPNDSMQTATVLGSVPQITLRDLTIHDEDDEDWFKITANQTGKLIINALFTDADGDVDIVVVDMNNNLLANSTSTTDNERIVIPVVTQGMYFLRVSGFDDDTNCYDLEIENFAVPTPSGIHLDPASDTGMMSNDNYTADNTPRLVIQADLSDFASMGIPIRDAAGAAALLPGAAVEVTITNSITGATVTGFANPLGASTTLFAFTPTVPLADGVYFASASVRIFDGQRNAAGTLIDTSRRGQLSQPLWFTVDTIAPEPATKDLIESSDTGMFNDDNVTNKMRPAFAGVAEPNAKIRVLAGGLIVGGGVVNTNGSWEITVEPLDDGMYDIAVQVEDLAGNITQSNGLTIWVDTTEPNTPLLDLVMDFDFGHSDTDNITNTGTPTFSITANDTPGGGLNPFPNDIKYRIYDRPGNALGEILLIDSFTGIPGFTTGGLFAHTLSQLFNDDFDGTINGVPLADGVHNFKLEVEDRAGNISHDFLLNVEIDTVAPVANPPNLLDSSDTGMLNDDNVTNKMSPAFDGISEVNSAVRVYANGVLVGQGVVASDNSDGVLGDDMGRWEVTVEPLADGQYDITVEIEDWAGNQTVSEALTIWIDTIAPNTPLLDLITDSGRHDDDEVTNFNLPMVTVTANDTTDGNGNPFHNDIKYRIYDRPGNAGTNGEVLLVDSFAGIPGFSTDGFFTHTLSQLLNDDFDGTINGMPLADGVHNLKLEVEDRAGNISHDFLLEITIDTIAPVATITGIDPSSSDTGVASQASTFADLITSDTDTGFVGTAEADSIVRMWADGAPISDGLIDASDTFQGLTVAIPLDGNLAFPNGQWNLAGQFDLNDPNFFPLDGTRQIAVTAEDLAGNVGELASLDIFIDTQGPRVADVFLTDHPLFDLFDPKPSAGPTPLVNRLSIKFTDLPVRTQQFLYEAVNQQVATTVGNYQLIGDQVGHILIEEILFEGMTIAGGGGGGGGGAAVSVAGGSGAVIIDGGDRDDHGSFDGVNNVDGWKFIEQMVAFADAGVLNSAVNDILVVGASADALDAINSAAGVLGLTTTVVTGAGIGAVNFSDYRIMYVPSDVDNTTGGITDADLAALTARKADVQAFVNSGGSLVALTEEGAAAPYAWLELPDTFTIGSPDTDTQYQTQALIDAGLVITDGELTNGTPLHNTFTGPPGFNGLVPFVYNVGADGVRQDGAGDDQIITLGLASGSVGIGAMPAMSTVTLVFAEPLPDDRYTLLVRDSIVDDAGNALDGESQVASPDDDPVFPSGDGQPGGDFLARFTVDSRPEIGTYCCGSVYIDINGNKIFDPEGQDNDQTNRDLVFAFGNSADALFAGQFTAGGFANGFDRLGAYGFDGGVYRFLLDLNDDGVADVSIPSAAQVNAAPIAGNFDGNAANGDEVGLFTGTQWFLDQVHANNVPAAPTIAGGNMRGYPIAGDFDGNGTDDLATFFGDRFFFDFNLDGNADATIAFGFAGVLDRPVAADLDQDGIDDIGLWVPGRSGVFPEEAGEFYFLMSNDPNGVKRVPGTVATLNHPFSPFPLGDDMFAQFGDEFASPIVGNFDPPVARTPGETGTPLQPPVVNESGWLQKLYSDVAGRAAQEGEINYWNRQMATGMNPQAVAGALLAGPEYRGRIIGELYQEILGRQVEAAGLSYWLDVWAGHGGPEIVKASLFGSAEYFANHGGTSTGFIRGLYQDVLNRAASSSEVAYWQGVLRTSSRTAVAMGFVTSNELRLAMINSWYQEFLGRAVDSASRVFWLQQLRAGAKPAQILANILGSAEYKNG